MSLGSEERPAVTEFDVAAARRTLRERGLSDPEVDRFLAKELLSASDVKFIRNVKEARIARQVLQSWGVEAVAREPGWPGESLFVAAEVWKTMQEHPGKGWRKGKTRTGPPTPREPYKVTPELRDRIVKLHRTPPAKLGLSFGKWTMARLAEYLQQEKIADISRETVRRILAEASKKEKDQTSAGAKKPAKRTPSSAATTKKATAAAKKAAAEPAKKAVTKKSAAKKATAKKTTVKKATAEKAIAKKATAKKATAKKATAKKATAEKPATKKTGAKKA
ncbi:helix-turn-helix domain-containing protein [Nocardia transvalensis]|uniref:helix-turn-helix domain-containing protein n=1 Tax=Nocardia transvalensis TaxID=37333 RepID=UPI0018930236|nr:helix-turn-helix domain-containing protein [Nocardia transvalensis]MBF6333524.1 helix-turn-helix domain-containing protein [Nocardia transvalensis]